MMLGGVSKLIIQTLHYGLHDLKSARAKILVDWKFKTFPVVSIEQVMSHAFDSYVGVATCWIQAKSKPTGDSNVPK